MTNLVDDAARVEQLSALSRFRTGLYTACPAASTPCSSCVTRCCARTAPLPVCLS